MASVEARDVSKWFPRRDGGRLHVLDGVDLSVPDRSVVAIVGQSGSGKSTLLNIVAGLVKPDRGSISLNGVDSRKFSDWRSMTYMFQDDRLLPWRTAAQNVAFGLEAAHTPRPERRERVAETLELVGLGQFADVYPHELSGGMRSRVALARSLVTRPTLLLMDEPFSRLDPGIRTQMHAEVLRIAELMKMTMLFVTHDAEEAVVLANEVVLLSPRPGRVRERRRIDLPYPRDPASDEVGAETRALRRSL
ncbi:ABC transporter ATP-binding protein [Chelatococcus sambhunathii]|uniref:ABC transporter ATP-binding protein n=1 Tax=Chelatococcus sambhunathii TaxID=363953 RepID=A0ABU1DIN0_9HYPH|nr:ABC transporter ATP-binding protein [Chelatococcus sambhunathii]MDR4307992.1 ABC transporter ATP-binding protein [Chelatococcus sambhunathii]